MKNILLLIISIITLGQAIAQCPTSTLTLTSQAEVDAFAINYPGCTNYDTGQLRIESTAGSDPVTNLDGLGGIQTFQTTLTIRDNPNLTVLSGLQNMQMTPSSSLLIYNNAQLTGFNNFLSTSTGEMFKIDVVNCPNLLNFSGLTAVTKVVELRIQDSGVTSLSGFEQLQEVKFLRLVDNPNLTSLDALSNVTISGNQFSDIILDNLPIGSVGSWVASVDNTTELVITNCDNLINLDGLENVQQLRRLGISYNDALQNVSALSNLSLIANDIFIVNNPSLTSLSVVNNLSFNPSQQYGGLTIWGNTILIDLPVFSSVPFTASILEIGENPLLISLQGLEGIEGITIGMYISRNHSITDIDPLSGIQEFDGDLRILENNNLTNIDGLSGITSIDWVFSDIDPGIYIEDNPMLQNVNGLSNITTIPDDHVIKISNNAILASLQGMDNLDLVSLGSDGVVDIINNPNLTTCNVQSICNLLGSNSPATITISGNDSGCEDEPAVVVSCGLDINIVSGEALFDFNINGCDPLDVIAPNVLIETNDGTNTIATFTNDLGQYQNFINVDGTVTTSVNPASLPQFFSASPASQNSTFSGFGNEDVIDYCITASQIINDVKISLIPLQQHVPGFDTSYQIIYENVGTTELDGEVTVQFDPVRQDFVSSFPTETSNTGGLITWDYVDLNPFESRQIFLTLNNFPPPTNEIDDEVTVTTQVFPITSDENPSDNTKILERIYVGAFDPNDKQVAQGEEIDESEVGEFLDYVIRFQNLGTADAINVVVEDILDDNLHWGSLRVLSASHDYRAEILNGNQVSFIFENINLPPEITDPQGSHGYISFQVRTDDTLVLGDEVSNAAAIFFDFNPPIITNTVTTVVTDLSPPVAICQSITVELDSNGEAAITPSDIDFGSNDPNGIASLELDITNFDCSDIGANTVVLTVTDTFGNISTCTATVTVVDNLVPEYDSATLPDDQLVLTDESGIYTLEDFTLGVLATDNCTANVLIDQTPTPGTALSPGVYDIELTATDDFFNTVDYTFELTVELLLGNAEITNDDVVIYPNPTSETLFISIANNALLEGVTVYSVIGEEVITSRANEIDVTQLSNGLYLVEVRTSEGIILKKIIKE